MMLVICMTIGLLPVDTKIMADWDSSAMYILNLQQINQYSVYVNYGSYKLKITPGREAYVGVDSENKDHIQIKNASGPDLDSTEKYDIKKEFIGLIPGKKYVLSVDITPSVANGTYKTIKDAEYKTLQLGTTTVSMVTTAYNQGGMGQADFILDVKNIGEDVILDISNPQYREITDEESTFTLEAAENDKWIDIGEYSYYVVSPNTAQIGVDPTDDEHVQIISKSSCWDPYFLQLKKTLTGLEYGKEYKYTVDLDVQKADGKVKVTGEELIELTAGRQKITMTAKADETGKVEFVVGMGLVGLDNCLDFSNPLVTDENGNVVYSSSEESTTPTEEPTIGEMTTEEPTTSENEAEDYEVSSILSYEQYQAKYYSSNAGLITSGYMTYSEIEDNYTPTEYVLNNILSFGWNKNFGFTSDAQVWETVILDILFKNGASTSTIESWEKNSVKLSSQLCEFINKNNLADLDEKFTIDVENNLDKLLKKFAETKELTNSEELTKVIKELADVAGTVAEFVDMYTKYIELRKVVDVDMKAFLVQMKYTDTYYNIPAFQTALDIIIANINVDSSKLVELIVKETVAQEIVNKAINTVIGTTVKLVLGEQIFQLFDITSSTTIHLMDTICGTRELAQSNVYLYIVDRVDEAAVQAFERVTETCLNSNGKTYYSEVNGGLQFITSMYTYGISVCRGWINVITTDILTRMESGPYTNVQRKHYDMATDYLNLNHTSSVDEKKKFIEDRCKQDENFVDEILKNQPAFARIQWYNESGADENEVACLVLFKVETPNGRSILYAQVVPKNTIVQFPEVETKNGYLKPTLWYTDAEYSKIADEKMRITDNTIFYTTYVKNILFEQNGNGGIKIISMNGRAQLSNARTTLGQEFVSCDIPAYIDGYKVVELGDDIFATYSNVTSVFIPGTVLLISDSAFDSLAADTQFIYIKGSVAETYITNKQYQNTSSEEELILKDNVVNMKVGEEKQLELEQKGSSASETISWTSSDSSIVRVENGIAYALKQGKVIITASTETVSTTCEVYVIENNIKQPDVNSDTGKDGNLSTTVVYNGAKVKGPKSTTVKKIKSIKKKLKVSWKKVKSANGYQIQYSTSKKFKKSKKITIKKAKTTSKTIKKLKSKKKYYVRIRTYITVNGKKYYSKWSNAKSQKTK